MPSTSLDFPTLALPLGLLLAAYVVQQQPTIRFAQLEESGVRTLTAIEPWLIEVQRQRRLVTSGERPTIDAAAIDSRRAEARPALEAAPASPESAASLAAAHLEKSASAIEEIGASVSPSANQSKEAARLADSNAQIAQARGRTVASVVETMQRMQAASSKISEIIGTIDGIAFQTNILALNAAVEAARAGDQGRGFAIVTSEVRALAQRSAAAKEIKGLITEVADSAAEQSLGVNQIGEAIQALDRQTQQNAALVEQTAAAASSLQDQAQALAARVARFRLPA